MLKCDPNRVLFKNDHIYQHNVLRVNYTSYDVRRCQDVMNPSTSHHNIIVLADLENGTEFPLASDHPFRYGRVLGVYHANVIYVGHGMINYQPHRLEFLWVRWYENTGVSHNGWLDRKLDRIQFSPMAQEDAFGFVDPLDIVRGCHIIPAFSRGKVHLDGKGMSRCAGDNEDWTEYYVNR
jgi:hypothetical protein